MVAESFNDALIDCVKVCGGSKSVGVAMWPALGVEAAQRRLLACLNPERNEKLGPEEVLMLMRMARERGCHAALEFICADLGYRPPEAITKEEHESEERRRLTAALEGVMAQLAAFNRRTGSA
jgi:hypothetical protein